MGIEFDAKKNLANVTNARFLRDLSLSGNVTFIRSAVKIPEAELESIRAQDPNHPDTRALFGQAPYIVNGVLTYINDSADFRVHALLQRARPQGLLGDPRRPAQRHAATHTHTRLQHGAKDGVRSLPVWLQGPEPAQPTQPPDPPLQWCRIRLVQLHTRPDLFGEPLLFDLDRSQAFNGRHPFSKAFSRIQIRAGGFPAFRRAGPARRAASGRPMRR